MKLPESDRLDYLRSRLRGSNAARCTEFIVNFYDEANLKDLALLMRTSPAAETFEFEFSQGFRLNGEDEVTRERLIKFAKLVFGINDDEPVEASKQLSETQSEPKQTSRGWRFWLFNK